MCTCGAAAAAANWPASWAPPKPPPLPKPPPGCCCCPKSKPPGARCSPNPPGCCCCNCCCCCCCCAPNLRRRRQQGLVRVAGKSYAFQMEEQRQVYAVLSESVQLCRSACHMPVKPSSQASVLPSHMSHPGPRIDQPSALLRHRFLTQVAATSLHTRQHVIVIGGGRFRGFA